MAGVEVGLAITTEVLFAVAKHCKDLCLAAKRYPEEAARIRLRLTYLLSRVPEWTDRINNPTRTVDDNGGCQHLAKNLYDSLTDLTLCVQAMGSTNDGSWRKKIQLFLDGKKLLDKVNEAESRFNQALDDLNHDNTHFVASYIPKILEQLRSVSNLEAKVSMMISLFNQFDQMPAGNVNNPTATMNDIIEATMEEYHTKDEVNSNPADSYNLKPTLSSFDISDYSITIDHRNVLFDTTVNTQLGTGGFAKVYEGIFNNNNVAVKVIDIYRNYDCADEMPAVIYESECKRVRDEAVIMKHCSIHSNIVDVYGYCPPLTFGSEPLIIMELMYAPLNKILHQMTDLVLSYDTRLQLMKDIANAVEFLHLQGIVHQDIKASNILVDEKITLAKLSDFGVAEYKGFKTTWAQHHTTALTTVLKSSKKRAAGTLAYLAPELVLEQVTVVSRSAEIYSLGVTIWECLSRTIPHHKEENKIFFRAQNKNILMMKFPVKDVIGNTINMIPKECDAFSLLEKVSLMCTSRDPSSRPTAAKVVHYLASTNDCVRNTHLSHGVINVNNWPVSVKVDPNELVTSLPIGLGADTRSMQFSEVVNSTTISDANKPTDPFDQKPIQTSGTRSKSNIMVDATVQPSSTEPGNPNVAGSEKKERTSMNCKLLVMVGLVVVVVGLIVSITVMLMTRSGSSPLPIVNITTALSESTCKEDAVGNEYGMYEGTFEGWRNFVNYTSQGITVDNWPESVGPFYCGMRAPQIPHTIEKGRIIWFEEKDYGSCPSHDVQLTFNNVNKQWIYNHSVGGDFRGPMNFTCFK